MCERGHADKMVLSHDANCYFDALPEELVPQMAPNWHYLHIHNDVIPALKERGVTDEQLHTMLVDNPRRIFERRALMNDPRPSRSRRSGRQISALAALAPDEPAVSCAGLTITRGELDRSTNRLARAYAERGVGVGDYVTIVLPNSIEWIQAALACWKLGAVPQPLSPRLPNAELEGLLGLRPRALLVGLRGSSRRDRKRCQRVSLRTRRSADEPSDGPCRRRYRRPGSRWPRGAAPAGPS